MVTTEEMRIGAARVALRALWTACVRAPTVFAPTRIQFDGGNSEADELQAAARLAPMRGPIELRGEEAASSHLLLRIAHAGPEYLSRHRRHPSSPRPLEFLRPVNELNSLVLAAGQAYLVSPATAMHVVSTFLFWPPVIGGGGPADSRWAAQFNLPQDWLERSGFVWMLGRPGIDRMSLPVHLGGDWNAQSVIIA